MRRVAALCSARLLAHSASQPCAERGGRLTRLVAAAGSYLASQPCARRGRWLKRRVAALRSARLLAYALRRNLEIGAAAGPSVASSPCARRGCRLTPRLRP